jgi:hypothetical protein
MELKCRLQVLESIKELGKYNQGEGGEGFATEGTNPRVRMHLDVATY